MNPGGLTCLVEGQGSCAGAWRSVMLFAVPGMLYTLTEFQVLQAGAMESQAAEDGYPPRNKRL